MVNDEIILRKTARLKKYFKNLLLLKIYAIYPGHGKTLYNLMAWEMSLNEDRCTLLCGPWIL